MRNVGTRSILTPRLLLRRYLPKDASAVFSGWAGDARLTRPLHIPPLADLAETKAVVRGWCFAYDEEPDYYRWAVTLQDSGTLIGSISAASIDRFLEPSFVLVPRWQGKGYAKEALKGMLVYLADAAAADYFVACRFADNPASGAVLSSAGFVPASPQELFGCRPAGRPESCLWYQLESKNLVRDIPVEF